MSDVKFACPYCSQHVLCDEIYCSEPIECPGCQREIFVPSRSTFVPLQMGNMTLEVPIASKERPPIRIQGVDVLSEKDWEERTSEGGLGKSASMLPVWILFLLPFVLAFLLSTRRAPAMAFVYCFVFCAIAGGFYLATMRNDSVAARVVKGLVYAVVGLVCFAIIGVGLLFVGCLAMMH
jgi:hypothetical protein